MFSKILRSKLFRISFILFFSFALFIILKLTIKGYRILKESYPSVVSEGFESGNLDYWKKELPGLHSCQVVTQPVRTGRYSARFEMRHGDIWGKGAARAELYEQYSPPFNKDVWYSFSTFIPNEWTNKQIRCLIAQWHGVSDRKYKEVNCSPPLGIEYNGKNFLIRICWNDKLVNRDNFNTTTHLTVIYASDEYAQKGVWHDFVINIMWSCKKGYLNIWIDKNKVVSYKGPIGYNDELAPLFKFGIYRDDIPETYVLYHDEFKRGFDRKEIDF